jgi:hypothetical protein
MPDSGSSKRGVVTIGILVLNLVLFAPLVFAWGLGLFDGGHARVLAICACFLMAGGFTRFWSTRLWLVVVPPAAAFLWVSAR